ncbi:hypothetical protein EV643_103344 [Kribbella sp. VKM Ac-2527]|uniref:Uncharacterized protein n=1 Tax=Kribbella caucasensis TaxID=2512215 RepID=A0A4R6KMH1_9ACTN|nr:hypothetical protein [Kribbella sp. VKM Ac-2527]TDO51605.1 hypothetical protein EV643_103344 [Kribbella sp. VKM Ac-2527]
MAHREVQVRIPLDDSYPSYVDSVLDEFADRLDAESEFCDDQEEEGDEVCFYLYGPDQDRLIEVARAALAQHSLLRDGVYAVKTATGRDDAGEGERISL